jgi:hypothetical protein
MLNVLRSSLSSRDDILESNIIVRYLNTFFVMTQAGEYMGINVHVMCKYICNRVSLVIKGPHVQV